EGAEELGGSRARDGAQVGDGLLACEPYAVVADCDGAGGTVCLDSDLQLLLTAQQSRFGQRGEAQPVVRIGGIGDQLTQEDFPVTVQGVNHQLQQVTDFCLKSEGLLAASLNRIGWPIAGRLLHRAGHDRSSPMNLRKWASCSRPGLDLGNRRAIFQARRARWERPIRAATTVRWPSKRRPIAGGAITSGAAESAEGSTGVEQPDQQSGDG